MTDRDLPRRHPTETDPPDRTPTDLDLPDRPDTVQSVGEFELMVLLAALRLGEEEAYAVSIVDEIHARTGRAVRRAAAYVTLQRLEAKGLVATRLGDPRPERGGKGRRLVRVTPAGVASVRAARWAFRSMWDGLEATLGGAR